MRGDRRWPRRDSRRRQRCRHSPREPREDFDLYYTTKKPGTGIGLSLVYRTIQLHNGDIDVESTPGCGTTFIIKMPQARRGRGDATEELESDRSPQDTATL